MALSPIDRFNQDNDLKECHTYQAPHQKHHPKWKLILLGGLVFLCVFGLLTQLPAVWTGKVITAVVMTWLVRIGYMVAGLAIITVAIKAFFSYVQKEFGFGPIAIGIFFVFGLLLALLS